MKAEEALQMTADYFKDISCDGWPVVDVKVTGHIIDDATRTLIVTEIEMEYCEVPGGQYDFLKGTKTVSTYGIDSRREDPVTVTREEL